MASSTRYIFSIKDNRQTGQLSPQDKKIMVADQLTKGYRNNMQVQGVIRKLTPVIWY